jgi:hypothetical protein
MKFMKWIFVACLIAVTLMSGCVQSGPKCNPPYIEYGDMHYCCLDANQNNVCDKYEKGAASTVKTSTTLKSTFATTLP